MKIVVVSGGFDPIHSGHISMIRDAKKLGDKVIVAINSDAWLTRKKGQPFMSLDERACVVSNLRDVDDIEVGFDDSDGTVCDALRRIAIRNPNDEIIFANGGDRGKDNVPEMSVPGVKCVFGVGGDNKANSSSWILAEWKAPKTDRAWGYYRVLHEYPNAKVKELTVDPGRSLSMQRHQHRAEYWLVTQGKARVNLIGETGKRGHEDLEVFDEVHIPVGRWHQLTNPYDKPLQVVEIQYGDRCVEEDIERQ